MESKLTRKTMKGFTDVLASKAPVPGGGGAASMVGAFGIALCSMVGNATVGRKKYAQYEDDLKAIITKGEALRTRFLEIVDEEAAVFDEFSKVTAMEKGEAREKAMEETYVFACKSPMALLETGCQAVDLLGEMLEKGSVTLVSDVGCGLECCKAAIDCAAMNVFVNTKAMKDRKKAEELNKKADALVAAYGSKADKLAYDVVCRMRADLH